MMKKIILIISFLISLTACSQKEKTEINNKKMDKSQLTPENYVATMLKEIKQYPSEPMYYIYVKNSLCVYEILVNDLPVRKQFSYEQLGSPIYINDAILSSGKQKITFRLYPAPEEFNSAGDKFPANTSFKVDVHFQNQKSLNKEGDDAKVAEFNLPTKTRMAGANKNVEIKEFIAEGQKYYEGSFTFEATVPYKNQGWSNGQNLAKLDPKKVEQKVIEFYKKQWSIYDKKDKNAMYSFLFNKEKEVRQSLFYNEKKLKDVTKSLDEVFDLPNYKVEPLQDYKMVFYGDGRIVALEQKSEDVRLKGESALWGFDHDPKEGRTAYFHYRYLYLPEGKTLDEFEIIR